MLWVPSPRRGTPSCGPGIWSTRATASATSGAPSSTIIQNYGGRATPVDIARDLFRELHSVTEMLVRMEKDGLVTRHKGTGRSKVEVSLTEKGRDVFYQSFHNETDSKIFSALTKKQRERLSLYLWKLRGRTLEHLGIPEWHFNFITQPYETESTDAGDRQVGSVEDVAPRP